MSTVKLHEKSAIGRRCYGFYLYRQLDGFEFPPLESKNIRIEDSSFERGLFDSIFSVNPLTKLPQGDISMYLSDKTNPDIKRFIELQLLQPTILDSDARGDFSALSDDDIVEFTRGSNESLSSYRSRVFETLKSDLLDSRNHKFSAASSE